MAGPVVAEAGQNGVVVDALAGGVVGRDRELAAAEQFLQSASGRFGVLEIVGDAGIGKTTIWRATVDRAEAMGFAVLACRPAEVETGLSLAGAADLLERVPEEVFAVLAEPQRRALEAVLLRAPADAPPPEPRTVAAAFRSVLVELSARQPVLVAVDDAQWLDAGSAAMLGFALRRLGHRPTGWLFAARRDAPRTLDLDRLVARHDIGRLELGPLSLATLHHVIERRLERSLTRPMLVEAHRASGGNPFFAIEVAREVLRSGLPVAGPAPVPPDLRDLLVERLRRLPARTQEALLMASAMSQPNLAVIADELLAPAEEAGLVAVDPEGRITFSHPLFAAAVHDSAPRAARRRVHAELAARVTDPEQRARHLAEATREPDAAAAHAVELGAARARARGAWSAAGDLLERARALTPTAMADDASRRGVAAAEHHVHAGDRQRARALLQEILDEPLSRSRRADALRLLAEICLNDESLTESALLLEEAIAYADDTDEMTRMEVLLGYVAINRRDFAGASQHAHRALELAETAGDHAAIGEALGQTVIYDFLLGRGVDWATLERAETLEDPTRILPLQLRPSAIAPFLGLWAGRHADARVGMDALRAQLVDTGDESDLAFVLLWWSWLETRFGNLSRAAALAQEAADLARLTGSIVMGAWVQMQHAYVGAHTGAEDWARSVCVETAELNRAIGHGQLNVWIAATLSLAEISVGNVEAAWAASAPLVEGLEHGGMGEPIVSFFLPDALDALVALGHLDRAENLIDALETSGRRLDRPWALAVGARCRAQLMAGRGDLAGAITATEDAMAEHQRIELGFERGRALLVKGMVERRLRQRTQARVSLEHALDVFEQMGASRWATRARAELDGLGHRRAAPDELTHAEQKVAELTARGLTRREVAAALFVSPKTVDATLVRVYRKLGIRSRAELGARLATDGRSREEVGRHPM